MPNKECQQPESKGQLQPLGVSACAACRSRYCITFVLPSGHLLSPLKTHSCGVCKMKGVGRRRSGCWQDRSFIPLLPLQGATPINRNYGTNRYYYFDLVNLVIEQIVVKKTYLVCIAPSCAQDFQCAEKTGCGAWASESTGLDGAGPRFKG